MSVGQTTPHKKSAGGAQKSGEKHLIGRPPSRRITMESARLTPRPQQSKISAGTNSSRAEGSTQGECGLCQVVRGRSMPVRRHLAVGHAVRPSCWSRAEHPSKGGACSACGGGSPVEPEAWALASTAVPSPPPLITTKPGWVGEAPFGSDGKLVCGCGWGGGGIVKGQSEVAEGGRGRRRRRSSRVPGGMGWDWLRYVGGHVAEGGRQAGVWVRRRGRGGEATRARNGRRARHAPGVQGEKGRGGGSGSEPPRSHPKLPR